MTTRGIAAYDFTRADLLLQFPANMLAGNGPKLRNDRPRVRVH